MAFYIPESQWGEIRKTGRANVHVDILQYLAEFGLIGFSLLALMLLIPAGAMVRSFYPTAALGARLASLGLTLVVIHSFIDIPFRSPGVLYHWLAVMAILPSFRSEIENA
jgi:O-antigen ligase